MTSRVGGRNPFAIIAFVDALGGGVLLSAGVIIYTRVLGIAVPSVGVALAVASAAAVVLVVPVSHFADRWSTRQAIVGSNLVMAGLVLLLLVRAGTVWFTAVLGLLFLFQRANDAVKDAALGRLQTDRILVRAQAYRAMNLGFAGAGIITAAAVASGSVQALRALVLVDALSYLVCAALGSRLAPAPSPSGDRPSGTAFLRDRRFLLACGLNIIGSLHGPMLFIALPLWILHTLHAPSVLIPVDALVNTALVVTLQGRLSAGLDEVNRALRVQAAAGVLLLTGCACAAAALPLRGHWQVLAVLTAAAVFSLCEVRQAAAGWAIAYAFSPSTNLAQYQALFGVSVATGDTIGPLLATFVILALPAGVGWIVIGVAAATISATGWAARGRWITRALEGEPPADPDRLAQKQAADRTGSGTAAP